MFNCVLLEEEGLTYFSQPTGLVDWNGIQKGVASDRQTLVVS